MRLLPPAHWVLSVPVLDGNNNSNDTALQRTAVFCVLSVPARLLAVFGEFGGATAVLCQQRGSWGGRVRKGRRTRIRSEGVLSAPVLHDKSNSNGIAPHDTTVLWRVLSVFCSAGCAARMSVYRVRRCVVGVKVKNEEIGVAAKEGKRVRVSSEAVLSAPLRRQQQRDRSAPDHTTILCVITGVCVAHLLLVLGSACQKRGN